MEDKVNYILDEIDKKIVCNYDENIKYLYKMLEKYTGHIYEKEIFNRINEIVVKLQFQNEFRDSEGITKREEKKYNTMYEKAAELVKANKKQEAKKVLEKFFSNVKNIYGNDEKVYVSLNGRIEYMLLKRYFKPFKKVYNISIKASEMYLLYADILIEEKNFEEATKYLLESINVNPVNPAIYLKLAETYMKQSKFKEFKGAIDNAYKYIYKQERLAKYYVYRSFLCIIARKVEYAGALLALAYYYKAKDEDIEMLYNTAKEMNQQLKRPTLKVALELISQTKIPIGANNTLYLILKSLYDIAEDVHIKEMYRKYLFTYTKKDEYKDSIKLSKEKDNIKNISKIVTTLYKGKYISLSNKDEKKTYFFDICTYFPNVVENMLKYQYGIEKKLIEVSCEYDVLSTPCDDCSFKNCPINTYCKKYAQIKDDDETKINMLDYVQKQKEYKNNEEDIKEILTEVKRYFKDSVSIKAAEIISDAGFVKDVREEKGKLKYKELNFENTTKENKIIETMQAFYKDEIGEEKEIYIENIRDLLKKKATCIFKEYPYIIAAFIINICSFRDVDYKIIYERILEKTDNHLSMKDLIYTRSVLQKLHNINVGRQLEKKLGEMIVYMAAKSKPESELPYIEFNLSLATEDEPLVLSIKTIILDVIKYYKYSKDIEIKLINTNTKLSREEWYAIKNEKKISDKKIWYIMYGNNLLRDRIFNIEAEIKDYSKKEIARLIMDKLEARYSCADDLLMHIKDYVDLYYKDSNMANTEYVDYVYKRIVYNLNKNEEGRMTITAKEIF